MPSSSFAYASCRENYSTRKPHRVSYAATHSSLSERNAVDLRLGRGADAANRVRSGGDLSAARVADDVTIETKRLCVGSNLHKLLLCLAL